MVRRTTTRLLSIGRDPCEVDVISARAGKVRNFLYDACYALALRYSRPCSQGGAGSERKIGDVKRRVNMLKETLQIVRDGHCQIGDAAKLFYQATKQKPTELQIDIPALPRGKANKHRGSTTLLEISEDDILNYYAGLYCSLFNAAIIGIDSRTIHPAWNSLLSLKSFP